MIKGSSGKILLKVYHYSLLTIKVKKSAKTKLKKVEVIFEHEFFGEVTLFLTGSQNVYKLYKFLFPNVRTTVLHK